MARLVMLAVVALAGGCFHAEPYSAQRTVATWQSMQSRPAPTAGSTAENPPADQPKPGEAVTADQAYAMALANSPDLAVLAAREEVAEAQVQAAKQLDNPQLRLTNFNVDDAINAGPGMNIGLRVPIPRPGTIRARTAGARLDVEVQASATAEARRQLRGRIDKLFARLAMLSADRAQVLRAAELRGLRREQVEARLERNVATHLDAALASAAHAEVREDLARIDEDIERVQADLEALVGAAQPLVFRVDDASLRVRDLELDRNALTEQALTSRPELRAAQTRIGQARAEVYVARSKAWPWFDWAQLQYRAGPGAGPTSFGFGVALTLPLFSLNRGEIRLKRAIVRQRELEERARIAAVAREVDAAIDRVERTARRVRALEEDLLPQAEAAEKAAESALAAGSLDPLVAGDVAAKTVAARRVHIAALLAHREAVIDLETAIGRSVADSPRP